LAQPHFRILGPGMWRKRLANPAASAGHHVSPSVSTLPAEDSDPCRARRT